MERCEERKRKAEKEGDTQRERVYDNTTSPFCFWSSEN